MDLDVLQPSLTHAHGLTHNVGGNQGRIQTDQKREYRVQGYRILGKEQYIHRHGGSRLGTISLHGHNTVHDVKPGFHQQVQVGKHPGKAHGIRAFGMEGHLVDAVYTAKGVFNCSGDPFQLMGLHLADIQDGIRFQDPFGQDKGFGMVSCLKGGQDPLMKIRQGNLIAKGCFFQATAFGCFFRSDYRIPRRIPIGKGSVSCFLHKADHPFKNSGVRSNTLFRWGLGQQIRFQQNLLFGP